MIVDVVQESQPDLGAYASVPIAFEVREVVDVSAVPPHSGRFRITTQAVATPWLKDYDAMDGGPLGWPTRFDLSRWSFFTAWTDGVRVGGAALVFRAPDLEMLGGRGDVAILWDIRVAPEARGQGVGRSLLAAAEACATAHGARWMEVETQDINAPACRFYQCSGFEVRASDPAAYPGLPNETQLIWYKQLEK